jgi:hypothetical protein
LLNLAKKFALALISDLFNSPSSMVDFLGEATPAPRDKTAKLAKSSKMTVQRNSLRGCDPPKQSASPTFLEEQLVFSCPRQFKGAAQMRGLLQIQMESIMPDL